MAFYMVIERVKNNNPDTLRFIWHIQSEKPQLFDSDRVMYLHADGDELELIVSRIKNIPYRYPITVWRYPLSQFVYDNLSKA